MYLISCVFLFFISGNSYKTRAMLAAVQVNTKSSFISMHKVNFKGSPSSKLVRLNERSRQIRKFQMSSKIKNKATRILRKKDGFKVSTFGNF